MALASPAAKKSDRGTLPIDHFGRFDRLRDNIKLRIFDHFGKLRIFDIVSPSGQLISDILPFFSCHTELCSPFYPVQEHSQL